MLKSAGWLLVVAALFGSALDAAAAEAYPSRPIRMILPIDGYHAAGTDPDNTARVTLDFLARHS